MILRFTLLVCSTLVFQNLAGQTCCSGGVPVSAHLGMPQAQAKALQIGLSYDLNNLSTLKSGSEILTDRTRKRTTHSLLFELGYSISDRWSIDLLLSGVRQERRIRGNVTEDVTRTNGFGDATILTKYTLIKSDRSSLTPGLGVKLPTGSSDLVRSDGIALNADLQPGSGALDLIYWLHYGVDEIFGPATTFYLAAVHSRKGINNDYLGSQAYQFGHEWQVSTGISTQVLIGPLISVPAIAMRYRHARFDVVDDQELPSTGGEWVFISPSFAISPTPESSFTASIDLPLMARPQGTQVTPTYRLNFAYHKKLVLRNNQ